MENSNAPLDEYRNWLELPEDITLMFLMKLQSSEILENAQFVCKLWYNLCKEPSMWRTIHMHHGDHEMELMDDDEMELEVKHDKMLINAVDRSAGGLIDLSIEGFDSDQVCSYVASRSSQLKCLRLARCNSISQKAFIGALEKLSSLEELGLTLCSFGYRTTVSIIDSRPAVSIINSCPALKTFKLNKRASSIKSPAACDQEAQAIAGRMRELRHLQLIGNDMTNFGLTAILDGCPHLQSLDLRACFHLNLTGDLEKRLLKQVMDVKRPYDSTRDYKYPTSYQYDVYGSDDYDPTEYDYDYDDCKIMRALAIMKEAINESSMFEDWFKR